MEGKKRDVDDRLFFRWAVMFQDQLSFDDFKKRIMANRNRSTKEILTEVYGIIRQFNEKGIKKYGDLQAVRLDPGGLG